MITDQEIPTLYKELEARFNRKENKVCDEEIEELAGDFNVVAHDDFFEQGLTEIVTARLNLAGMAALLYFNDSKISSYGSFRHNVSRVLVLGEAAKRSWELKQTPFLTADLSGYVSPVSQEVADARQLVEIQGPLLHNYMSELLASPELEEYDQYTRSAPPGKHVTPLLESSVVNVQVPPSLLRLYQDKDMAKYLLKVASSARAQQ